MPSWRFSSRCRSRTPSPPTPPPTSPRSSPRAPSAAAPRPPPSSPTPPLRWGCEGRQGGRRVRGSGTLGQLGGAVGRRLHGGEERSAHLVDLQLAQRRRGGASR